MKLVFVGNVWKELSLCVSLGLENSVGGKSRRSGEATSVFSVQLCRELLSDEHSLCLCSLETFGVNCLCTCVSALGLKNPFEGNTGDQEQLCLFSFPSFVWNYYLINILNTRLYWNWSEWIVSVSLGKFSWNSEVLFVKRVCTNNPSRSLQWKFFGVWWRFAFHFACVVETPRFYLHKNFLQCVYVLRRNCCCPIAISWTHYQDGAAA